MNNFLNPGVLWNVLWIVPVMGLVYISAQQRRGAVLKELFGAKSESADLTTLSKKRRQLRCLIEIGIVIFLIVAAARPYWGFRPRPFLNKGRDIVFIFDTSKSMLAADVKPSRLKHAQWLVKEIAAKFPQDRFGLVSFAGVAFLECPLTIDALSFEQAVNDLSVESMPVGGTNVEAGLSVALKSTAGSLSGNSAFVLISDGDELDGNSRSVLSDMNAAGIPLFVVGVGELGRGSVVTLPGKSDGEKRYLRDRSGAVVMCKLNEALLSELADEGRGRYIRSATERSGVDEITQWLNGLDSTYSLSDKNSNAGMGQTLPIDRFQYPLAVSFILILLWLFVSERVSVKAFTRKFNIAIIILCCLYAEESSAEGAEADGVSLYNRAVAILNKGDVAGARDLFSKVVNSSLGSDAAQAYSYFNLAVIAQQKGERSVEELRSNKKLDKAVDKQLARECVLSLQLAHDMYARASSFDVTLPQLSTNLGVLQQLEREARRLGVVFDRNQKVKAEVDSQEKPDKPEKPDQQGRQEKQDKPEQPDKKDKQDRQDLETPEELMDAMIDDEKETRLKFKRDRGQKRGGARVDKDW